MPLKVPRGGVWLFLFSFSLPSRKMFTGISGKPFHIDNIYYLTQRVNLSIISYHYYASIKGVFCCLGLKLGSVFALSPYVSQPLPRTSFIALLSRAGLFLMG